MDPIVSAAAVRAPQLWNRYAYALNGPLRFSDRAGLAPSEQDPEMEPNTFDYEAFEAEAEGFYVSYMLDLLQDGLVSFEAYLNALPLAQRKEFGMYVNATILSAVLPYLGVLPGGSNETGFVTFTSPNGSSMEFVRLMPGLPGDPDKVEKVTINLADTMFPNPNRLGPDWLPAIAVHTHPGGVGKRGGKFQQRSNPDDWKALGMGGFKLGIVIGMRKDDLNAYFYNRVGTLGNMSLKKFLALFPK